MSWRRCVFISSAVLIISFLMTACGDLIVLLPDEQGKVGQLTVGEADNKVVLDSANETAKVGSSGQTSKNKMSEKKVESVFAEALAAEPPKSKVYVLNYDLGSTIVLPMSKPELESLFAEIESRKAVEVVITGHTDRVGPLKQNDRLSLRRAERIQDMLLVRGLKADFIRVVGRGEREPVVETRDEMPEPKNRRVEVIVR
jgi:outer membrane protein OmpA-like peptidoglycan-associated protein